MGLDNGIYIANWETIDKKDRNHRLFSNNNFLAIDNMNVLEIAYWRRQYTLRDMILNNFFYRNKDCIYNTDGDYEEGYILDIDDIDEIINILKLTLNKNFWIDNHFNMWIDYFCDEFQDYKNINKKYIKNLKLLKKYKRKYKDLKIVFYDSF